MNVCAVHAYVCNNISVNWCECEWKKRKGTERERRTWKSRYKILPDFCVPMRACLCGYFAYNLVCAFAFDIHIETSHFDYALISDTDNNFIDIALERLKSIQQRRRRRRNLVCINSGAHRRRECMLHPLYDCCVPLSPMLNHAKMIERLAKTKFSFITQFCLRKKEEKKHSHAFTVFLSGSVSLFFNVWEKEHIAVCMQKSDGI